MELIQHNVTKVELSRTYVENSGSRTIRITANDLTGNEMVQEITLYGDTEALDALPRSSDFIAHPSPEDRAA